MNTRTEPHGNAYLALGEIFSFAYDTFCSNKVRFALTALGMVIGTASLILVTRTFTPWISIPVNRPLGTSSAEHSLCQANSQLPCRSVADHRRRWTSDRIVRALVKSAGVEDHVPLEKARALLADPEPIVISADQEQLRLARVDV